MLSVFTTEKPWIHVFLVSSFLFLLYCHIPQHPCSDAVQRSPFQSMLSVINPAQPSDPCFPGQPFSFPHVLPSLSAPLLIDALLSSRFQAPRHYFLLLYLCSSPDPCFSWSSLSPRLLLPPLSTPLLRRSFAQSCPVYTSLCSALFLRFPGVDSSFPSQVFSSPCSAASFPHVPA